MNGRPIPVDQAARQIVDVGRVLYERGLIAATEGNVSVRIADNRFLTTPSGLCKGRLRNHDVVTVDANGHKRGGHGVPSSEIRMHLAIYEERPDVLAIVHAHPPVATGFAVASVPLAGCVLPEIILTVGSVPLTDYGTPSTDELPARIRATARSHDAFLLKNHGAVASGTDLWDACHKMEMIESFAKIVLTARHLGRVESLSADDVDRLLALKKGAAARPHAGCGGCVTCEIGRA